MGTQASDNAHIGHEIGEPCNDPEESPERHTHQGQADRIDGSEDEGNRELAAQESPQGMIDLSQPVSDDGTPVGRQERVETSA